MQPAQLYVMALVAGGALSAGCLLVGSFGRREGEGFTPAAWAVALASGLWLGGGAGLLAVVAWPSRGQQGSLAPALCAAGAGAVLGWAGQRWARRSWQQTRPPSSDSGQSGQAPDTADEAGQVASGSAPP